MVSTKQADLEHPKGLVVVADDDPAMRALASAALQQDGHRVLVAKNGEEACRLFLEHEPDLMLMDIGMPVVDGYEACERLRRRPDSARLPILMLTGEDDPAAISRAYDVGATDFQTKPVNWRVLAERVRYMLRAKRDADELVRLAHYDSLTGLPNRATFRNQLSRALARSQRTGGLLAVIFLDLDGFKEINDTSGHGFGDQVLKLTAARLTHSLRSGDIFGPPAGPDALRPSASRFGGDEFTVVVPDLPNGDASTAIADRIRDGFSRPLLLQGEEVYVSVSTGVSVYPFDGPDADTLLKHADAAMYAAKAVGRNHHSRYLPVMESKASDRLSLGSDLRRALTHDELRLHFQPKISIDSGAVVGAEALIRWLHPERGFLPPSQFVDVAEEIGLGPQIGDWVIHTALAQAARWQSARSDPFPIAVNLSNSQFRNRNILDHIRQSISSHGLDARSFEVEITENVVIRNPPAARELLEGFKALGIRTAIDDFGTGQSALSTVTGLPFEILKMDRAFIRAIETSTSDRAVTASIIDIGHHLGMTVIAEGVETARQLELLSEMGCDQAQGFLFSEGLPADEFEVFLATRTRRANQEHTTDSASNGQAETGRFRTSTPERKRLRWVSSG